MSPSFDFIKNRFKSKPKLKPESSDQAEIEAATKAENTAVDRDYDLDRNDENELALEASEISDPQRIAQLSGKAVSVEEATNRLRNIKEQKTIELVQQLTPIRDSAQASLQSIVDLASDLQNDEIKVENERFESAVENARSMVISGMPLATFVVLSLLT